MISDNTQLFQDLEQNPYLIPANENEKIELSFTVIFISIFIGLIVGFFIGKVKLSIPITIFIILFANALSCFFAHKIDRDNDELSIIYSIIITSSFMLCMYGFTINFL
jgi:hypothetical protein